MHKKKLSAWLSTLFCGAQQPAADEQAAGDAVAGSQPRTLQSPGITSPQLQEQDLTATPSSPPMLASTGLISRLHQALAVDNSSVNSNTVKARQALQSNYFTQDRNVLAAPPLSYCMHALDTSSHFTASHRSSNSFERQHSCVHHCHRTQGSTACNVSRQASSQHSLFSRASQHSCHVTYQTSLFSATPAGAIAVEAVAAPAGSSTAASQEHTMPYPSAGLLDPALGVTPAVSVTLPLLPTTQATATGLSNRSSLEASLHSPLPNSLLPHPALDSTARKLTRTRDSNAAFLFGSSGTGSCSGPLQRPTPRSSPMNQALPSLPTSCPIQAPGSGPSPPPACAPPLQGSSHALGLRSATLTLCAGGAQGLQPLLQGGLGEPLGLSLGQPGEGPQSQATAPYSTGGAGQALGTNPDSSRSSSSPGQATGKLFVARAAGSRPSSKGGAGGAAGLASGSFDKSGKTFAVDVGVSGMAGSEEEVSAGAGAAAGAAAGAGVATSSLGLGKRLRSGATLLAGVVDAINRGVSFGSVCSLLKTQGVAALADPATGELHARAVERLSESVNAWDLGSAAQRLQHLIWLGKGAQGVVYSAHWRQRRVAVKFMVVKSAHAQADREGMAGAATGDVVSILLSHPNVVQTLSWQVFRVTEATLPRQISLPALSHVGSSASFTSAAPWSPTSHSLATALDPFVTSGSLAQFPCLTTGTTSTLQLSSTCDALSSSHALLHDRLENSTSPGIQANQTRPEVGLANTASTTSSLQSSTCTPLHQHLPLPSSLAQQQQQQQKGSHSASSPRPAAPPPLEHGSSPFPHLPGINFQRAPCNSTPPRPAVTHRPFSANAQWAQASLQASLSAATAAGGQPPAEQPGPPGPQEQWQQQLPTGAQDLLASLGIASTSQPPNPASPGLQTALSLPAGQASPLTPHLTRNPARYHPCLQPSHPAPSSAESEAQVVLQQVLVQLAAQPGDLVAEVVMELCHQPLHSAIQEGVFNTSPWTRLPSSSQGCHWQHVSSSPTHLSWRGSGGSSSTVGGADRTLDQTTNSQPPDSCLAAAAQAQGWGVGQASGSSAMAGGGGSPGRSPHLQTLAQRVAALGRLLSVSLDIAAGMHHLHSMRILHGDLKASNVMLVHASAEGADLDAAVGRWHATAKVSDFGSARIQAAEGLATRGLGTLAYCAPEVHRGTLLPASDVWSFGGVLFMLVTGQQAFAGLSRAQIMLGVVQGSLRLQWPPWTPAPLAALGASCMSHEAAARPSFADIVDQLERMQAGLQDMLQGRNLAPDHSSEQEHGQGSGQFEYQLQGQAKGQAQDIPSPALRSHPSHPSHLSHPSHPSHPSHASHASLPSHPSQPLCFASIPVESPSQLSHGGSLMPVELSLAGHSSVASARTSWHQPGLPDWQLLMSALDSTSSGCAAPLLPPCLSPQDQQPPQGKARHASAQQQQQQQQQRRQVGGPGTQAMGSLPDPPPCLTFSPPTCPPYHMPSHVSNSLPPAPPQLAQAQQPPAASAKAGGGGAGPLAPGTPHSPEAWSSTWCSSSIPSSALGTGSSPS